MDVAVGVRRTVMQDELLPPHGLFAHSVVEAKPRPALEQLRLALGQPCLHREVGLGEEQGRAPVAPDLRGPSDRSRHRRRWLFDSRFADRRSLRLGLCLRPGSLFRCRLGFGRRRARGLRRFRLGGSFGGFRLGRRALGGLWTWRPALPISFAPSPCRWAWRRASAWRATKVSCFCFSP